MVADIHNPNNTYRQGRPGGSGGGTTGNPTDSPPDRGGASPPGGSGASGQGNPGGYGGCIRTYSPGNKQFVAGGGGGAGGSGGNSSFPNYNAPQYPPSSYPVPTGLDGTLLPEAAAMENQILLFHQQILQVMFLNPHFH